MHKFHIKVYCPYTVLHELEILRRVKVLYYKTYILELDITQVNAHIKNVSPRIISDTQSNFHTNIPVFRQSPCIINALVYYIALFQSLILNMPRQMQY